jgi:phosphoribosyl 1,2-cyclic phosphodiesterase
MRFASLGSGSKGNATLVQAGDTLVMVDCGFSLREVEHRMERLALGPDDLHAILVTHEHSDHSSGVARLSARYGIPVYLTHGTASSGRCDGASELRYVGSEDLFQVGDLKVHAVRVPHDAAEPCQFRFEWGDRHLGILTDLGCVTAHVVERYSGCNSLMLEFNHDSEMLATGPYPPSLKRRVGGDWGHLNNRQAMALLQQLGDRILNNLVVAHVSEKNNARPLVEAALEESGADGAAVTWACQVRGFDWLEV